MNTGVGRRSEVGLLSLLFLEVQTIRGVLLENSQTKDYMKKARRSENCEEKRKVENERPKGRNGKCSH